LNKQKARQLVEGLKLDLEKGLVDASSAYEPSQ
jgi:hypothetical protein